MKQPNEKEILNRIANEFFEIDIKKRSNKRLYVDARRIFSTILLKRGFTLTDIGDYLNRDHTTIINCTKDTDHLIKTNPNLNSNYVQIKDSFIKEVGGCDMTKREIEMEKTIAVLNSQIDELILKNTYKHERLQNIIEFIDSRTPKGKESFVLKKINLMFNGITDYEQQLE